MFTKKIDKLKLYFDPKIDDRTEIEKIVKTAYKKNLLFFDGMLKNDYIIYLLYDRKDMDNILKIKTKQWLVGTTTKDGVIYIFSPKVFSKVSSHKSSNFNSILIHELAHIFTNEMFGFSQPVWLREGIAGHIAQQYKDKTPKKLNDFEKLHNKKDWNNNPNYAQASCFTTFLIEKIGKNKFLDFLKILSQNKTFQENFTKFSEIFFKYFNINFEQTISNWQKSATLKKSSAMLITKDI